MKKLQTIALCMLIMFMSCDKDDSPSNYNPDPDPSAFAENFGSEIQRNFLGKVIDSNHNPIQNVTITIGNKTAQTDANGIFIISDANVYQRFGYIKAEKVGYLHGSRSVVPSEGTNKVTIMLLEETVVGTTNSGTAETITLSNGASVALQGDYVKEDGTVYSGSVNVIMHHLDPADEDMQDQMPGMLYAANAQNEERMLQTFGMLAVELKGSGGETLNLADGSSAEIKVPLDASFLADAPSTIPLWHFDETHGYWVEDGQATLVGNAYVGTVTHFSNWFFCMPSNPISLCIEVTDENNNPLHLIGVRLSASTGGEMRYGVTNELGLICGIAPSNSSFQLQVYNQTCQNIPIYTVNIGPFTSSSTYTIVIPSTIDSTTETILGNFNDCNGNPINNGYVKLDYGDTTFFDYVDNSGFEFNLLRCSTGTTNFSLEGQDYENIQTTGIINYTFSSPITNVGNLFACNTVDEFISYQIDNNPATMYFFNISSSIYFSPTTPTIPRLNISNGSILFQARLFDSQPYTGTYPYQYINDNIGFFIEGVDITTSNNNSIIFNVTSLGNVGEYIDINFSGDYEDFDGNPHTLTGTIHVLRDN